MIRPSWYNYLIGNPVSALAIFAVGGYVLYLRWIGATTNIAAVVTAFVMIGTVNASDRLSRYRDWKRKWDGLAGHRQGPGVLARLLRTSFVRVVLILMLDAGALAYVDRHPYTPEGEVVGLLFLGGNGLVVIGVLYRLVRWLFVRPRRSAAKAAMPVDVAVCIPLPKQAARHGNLPDYLHDLMEPPAPDEVRTAPPRGS